MSNEMNLPALKALADPTRLHIVQFLAAMCRGQATVREDGGVEGPTAGEVCCHITGAEKITSTVSHHLHELEDAGLIRIERRGKTMVCTLRTESLLALSEHLHTLAHPSDHNCACCGEGCCPV